MIPRAELITPNTIELRTLSGIEVDSTLSILAASRELLALGAGTVFAKGGHRKVSKDICTDIYADATQRYVLPGTR